MIISDIFRRDIFIALIKKTPRFFSENKIIMRAIQYFFEITSGFFWHQYLKLHVAQLVNALSI